MFGLVPFRRNNHMRMGDYVDNFFDDFFNDDFLAPIGFNSNSFRVNVRDTGNEYIMEAALPGVKKDQINLEYRDNYLTVSAKREDRFEDNSGDYIRREIRCGEFKRSFYVDNIDKDKIDASFKDGVLKVVLPKLEKQNRDSHKIDIH